MDSTCTSCADRKSDEFCTGGLFRRCSLSWKGLEDMYSYPELLDVIAELRSDHGCPWDKAQTHESMIPCLRDECEEVIQAIEQKDDENLCEELGDVLLQVLLHAQIAKEEGRFTMDDVVNGLAEKMVRRHPHVFGDEEYGSLEQNRLRWEEIKNEEKKMKKNLKKQ